MADSEPTTPGIFKSLRRLLGTSVAVLLNRVELFAVELQEEKHRQIELLLLAGGALLLGGLGLVVFTAVVIFLFDPPHRLLAASVVGTLYLLGAVFLLARVKARLNDAPFSESINQIKKDVECLTPPKNQN